MINIRDVRGEALPAPRRAALEYTVLVAGSHSGFCGKASAALFGEVARIILVKSGSHFSPRWRVKTGFQSGTKGHT